MSIPIDDDALSEARESFSLELYSPTNLTIGRDNATATIVDNDHTAVIGTNLGERIFGTSFSDRLDGMGGNDTLTSGADHDTLTGGGGNDLLDGGEGIDRMAGGVGNDIYRVDNQGDIVVEAASQGVDHVQSAVNYTLRAHVENLTLLGTANLTGNGNAAANILNGNVGGNRLSGFAGNDTINGGIGSDVLDGGVGNDRLVGSTGADRMIGGGGADSFVFFALSDSTAGAVGRDTITDFSRAQHDLIDLSGIDANTRVGGNQAFSYLGDAAFTGHAGQLSTRAVAGGTMISGDVNGDRVADFALLIDDRLTLGADSFIL